MTNTYKLSVNDEFEFQLDAQDVNSLDTSLQPNNKQHILEDFASQSVHIENKDVLNRQYTVRINGNRYQVVIKNDLDLLIEEMGLSLGANAIENDIFAPMPGVILSVDVKEGDSVKEGDTLCVLEAMKMENALLSPRDGVIKSIEVSTADTVEKNALLLTLEPLS